MPEQIEVLSRLFLPLVNGYDAIKLFLWVMIIVWSCYPGQKNESPADNAADFRSHLKQRSTSKLFAPLLVALSIDLIWEIYFHRLNPNVVTVLKFGIMIYYLRLDNTGTPLISALTAMLILMGFGEYFPRGNAVLGEYCLARLLLSLG